MANSPRNSLGNVRSDMDITYPEHLSRLHRHSVLTEYPKSFYNPKKNTRSRRGNRYRTQPVTFDEIQEVDEESMPIEPVPDDQKQKMSTSLELEFDLFRFSKALGSKLKTTTTTSAATQPGDLDSNKAEKSIQKPNHMKPADQLRWTDYTREGSV
ncbi:hypothetical protein X975_02062, partial [Stegodyphus mimosarum]